ncbi:Ger(x)C family spore germination protein [Priestia megaterium]
MKRVFIKKVILLCLILLILSGCWDVKDLQKISFVTGLAIDELEDKKIGLTYQILLPQNASDPAKSGAPQFMNVKSKGENVLKAVSQVSLKEDPIYSEHLKMLLFGEKLARKRNLQGLINYFIRDDEVRRSTYVVLTKGYAGNFLEIPTKKKTPIQKLVDISNNKFYNGGIIIPTRLGQMSENLQANISFFIQAVSLRNNELVYDGAGIISEKTNKLLGFVSSKDVQSLQWVIGKSKGGIVPLKLDKRAFTYEILTLESKVKPKLKDGKLTFDIIVKTNGKISEDWNPQEDSFRESYLHKVEKRTAEKMEADIQQALYTIQKKYKADPIGLGSYVHIRYPAYWKQNKASWDEIFSKTRIHYKVKVDIKNFGTKGRGKRV